MKKLIKLLSFLLIVSMIIPFTFVNANTSRTKEIVESLKESAKSYDGTVNYDGSTIEIEWNIRDSKSSSIEFTYNDNVIEYDSGEIKSYEQAVDATSHYMYAIYLIKSALRVNGYTDEQIQSFFQGEPSYEINGIEFKKTGESQQFTSEDGTITTTATPMLIKIDVTKANVNTSSDEPVAPKSTTVEDIITDLQNDSEFTTMMDDEGNVYSEHEIFNEDNIITISNTYYIDNYHNVLFDCEEDVLTYEDEIMNDYYDAERALSHQMYANQILMLALRKNGYTDEQIQEFMSSEDNEFDYELNGIEIKETGEEKKFISEDGLNSVSVTPMSIKIDLGKANLKKAVEEQTQTKEYTIASNTNSGDSISFTAPEGTFYSLSIIDRLGTTDEELQKMVDLFNDPEYTFEILKEQLNKIISYGKNAAGSGTLLKIYEIYLTSNGVEVHEVDGGFKIKLKITDDIKGYDSYKLVYIAEDGSIEDAITLKSNKGYLEGTLPHLSMYALVGNKNQATNITPTPTNNITNNPKTGDNVMLYFSMFGLSIIGLVGTGVYLKKERFN